MPIQLLLHSQKTVFYSDHRNIIFQTETTDMHSQLVLNYKIPVVIAGASFPRLWACLFSVICRHLFVGVHKPLLRKPVTAVQHSQVIKALHLL